MPSDSTTHYQINEDESWLHAFTTTTASTNNSSQMKRTTHDQSDVTAHIEGCTDCQSRLEAIAEAGIRWDDVRRFLQPEDTSTCRDAGSTPAFVSGETSGAGNVDFLSPSDDPNSLGRFGRYEIKEILGRGGMGVVMRGYDPALARHSAIKVLAPELATSASARNRFARGEISCCRRARTRHSDPNGG